MNAKLWWYVARSGGLVAWWTVSASVFAGLLMSTRVLAGRPKPAWLLRMHRFLGGLAVSFTAVHVAGLVGDNYVHFGWSEVFVPLASRWHPVAVAWGIVGLYLLVAIEVTSLMMRRLPKRLWRAVHTSSFGLFVLAGVHAASAGTDGGNVAVQWSGLVISAAFTFLLFYRQLADRTRGAGRQSPKRRSDTPTAGPNVASRPLISASRSAAESRAEPCRPNHV